MDIGHILGIKVDSSHVTTQNMKFSIIDFGSKCDQIRGIADLVTFTEEIRNGRIYFLSSW